MSDMTITFRNKYKIRVSELIQRQKIQFRAAENPSVHDKLRKVVHGFRSISLMKKNIRIKKQRIKADIILFL